MQAFRIRIRLDLRVLLKEVEYDSFTDDLPHQALGRQIISVNDYLSGMKS